MPSSSRRKSPFCLHARLIALAALCAAVSSAGYAAVISWDGGGSDDNWETPENWTGDQVPGPADDVLFGQLSSKNCVINQNHEVAGLTVTTRYDGTVSYAGSFNLTV
ncbi:hypothetical protein IIC65_07595 [Candidatus Sumerlaeota bacterium]|nr:hypothetical protein [Candidatus Sumerlaeota bacterium]